MMMGKIYNLLIGAAGCFFLLAGTSKAGTVHATFSSSHHNVTPHSTNCTYDVPCSEVDALIALYNATGGTSWTNNTNWLSSLPVDEWYGVEVVSGHVNSIYLDDNNLTGSIPSDIQYLTEMRILYLARNNIGGAIPPEIGALTKLMNLILNDNNLSGTIPPEIGNLSTLVSFNIYSNNIGGTIPLELMNCTNMVNMNLGINQLSGSLPAEIGQLTNLTQLRLYSNNLSGPLPPEIGNLTKLKFLYLSSNQFSGSLPPEIGNLINLQWFEISSNLMTGAIPPELGNLTQLHNLSLANNNFSGPLPDEFTNLSSLTYLWLYSNQLSGTLPAAISNLANLRVFEIYDNQFSGSLPDFTGFPTMSSVSVQDNLFQFGDMEYEWSYLTSSVGMLQVSPQAKVNQEQTFNLNAGDDITLSTVVSGTQNTYQWYKNGMMIDGATNADLVLTNVLAQDAGNYYCLIQSNIVTTLTLQRNTIHINISGDTQAPQITCISDQTLTCGSTLPDYTTQVTATDNVDTDVSISQQPAAGSVITDGMTVTFTATDNVGNETTCSITITVTDDISPLITCPGDQVLSPGDLIPDYTVLASVTDNCDADVSITQSPLPGATFTSAITVTLTATDDQGNSSLCTFNVASGVDTQAPQITCISNQTLACGNTLPDYTTQVTATDNVDTDVSISQQPAAGSVITDGMTVTFTATDDASNETTCSITITVTDDISPLMTCPADQVLSPGDLIPDYTALASVTDNCDADVLITQSPIAGAAFTSAITVTLTATDDQGNSSLCTFNVAVGADTRAPQIACPGDITIACGDQLPDFITQATVSDNTDPNPQVVQTPVAGTIITEETIVILTATDDSGNQSNCSFTVHITTDQMVDAGSDREIFLGESVQLTAVADESGEFSWFPSVGLSDPTQHNPLASPVVTTTYEVVFANEAGCVSVDDVTVVVKEREGIKTKYAFSPDGDGVNDVWVIETIDLFPENKVMIYNRWGNLVFKMDGYDNAGRAFVGYANHLTEWGAGKLPEGTYLYTIQRAQDEEPVRGFIVLKR